MQTVTVSPKFQVVIPKKTREQLGMKPGQKMQVIAYENHIVLVPLQTIESTRGFLKGIETTIEREEDRL